MKQNKPQTTDKAIEVKQEISPVQGESQALQQMVDIEVEKRRILTGYITHHMKEGIDFGKIHINKNCPDKYNCKNSYHFSKNCLFKPGGEKFVSLMKLRVIYKRDNETWEMAGSIPGLFCYVCQLIDSRDVVVGEGRGSASTQEKGSANTAIKTAEKRAKMDAVLSTGGLSDFFTQDLEDMAESNNSGGQPAPYTPRQMAERKETGDYTREPYAPAARPVQGVGVALITITEQQEIFKLVKEVGKEKTDLDKFIEKAYPGKRLMQLTLTQAKDIIRRLEEIKAKKFERDEEDSMPVGTAGAEDVDPDDIPNDLGQEKKAEQAAFSMK